MARGHCVGAAAGLALAFAMMISENDRAFAASGGEAQLPRFEALHADKVNLRSGPGDRYPIQWVYVRRDWPVEVIAQWDHWRRVRDWEGTDALLKQTIAERGGDDPPSQAVMMWTRIFRERPPEDDWDGTIERREK